MNSIRGSCGFGQGIAPRPNHVLRIGWDNEAVRTPLPRLRDSDGVADAAEDVVAAVAAAGGDDEVVFAARDRIAKGLIRRIQEPVAQFSMENAVC